MRPNVWCGQNGTGVLMSLKETNMLMGATTQDVIQNVNIRLL